MSARYARQYDALIAVAAAAHLSGWDWLWLKAELIAESDLDSNAVSPAGAQGIAQFMPNTWKDACAALRFPANASPFDPDYAITAAAWYLAWLRKQWRAPRRDADRRRLTQASYNAGLGRILEAQKRAGGAADYDSIIAQLHNVTGEDKARETREYVARIGRIYNELADS